MGQREERAFLARLVAFQNQMQNRVMRKTQAEREHLHDQHGGKMVLECAQCVEAFALRVAAEHPKHERFNVDCEHCRRERQEKLIAEHPNHGEGDHIDCQMCSAVRRQKRMKLSGEHSKHHNHVDDCSDCSWNRARKTLSAMLF